ncbi:SDR family oxidoreductase [Brevundimonas sp. UBA7616]|uniref:SDR family oxidoreductase n=1 Tax=unclassified Brevundimonas TaxID=2622653 RepID=UPI003BB927CB
MSLAHRRKRRHGTQLRARRHRQVGGPVRRRRNHRRLRPPRRADQQRRADPGFLEQGSGHIINLSSVAGIKVFPPGGTVYSGTKFAVSAISEGLRHEVGEKVRVTSIEPGAVESDLKFTTSGTAAETVLDFYKQAIPAASVARAIAFAVEQPDDVDVNAIVIRPTAQQF